MQPTPGASSFDHLRGCVRCGWEEKDEGQSETGKCGMTCTPGVSCSAAIAERLLGPPRAACVYFDLITLDAAQRAKHSRRCRRRLSRPPTRSLMLTPMRVGLYATCVRLTISLGQARLLHFPLPCTSGVCGDLDVDQTPINAAVLVFSDMADKSYAKMKTPLRYSGWLGFFGGFLLAYQRSSCERLPRLVVN